MAQQAQQLPGKTVALECSAGPQRSPAAGRAHTGRSQPYYRDSVFSGLASRSAPSLMRI